MGKEVVSAPFFAAGVFDEAIDAARRLQFGVHLGIVSVSLFVVTFSAVRRIFGRFLAGRRAADGDARYQREAGRNMKKKRVQTTSVMTEKINTAGETNITVRSVVSNLCATVVVSLMAVTVTVSPAQAQVLDLFDEQMAQDEAEVGGDGEAAEEEETDQDRDGLVIDRGGNVEGPDGADGRTIRLEYERRGQAILVPARVGRQEAYFMFDTGASYTTLTAEFARSAGVYPRRNYPETQVQTAGGVQSTRFGLIERFQLGGQGMQNVSFTLCDPCGGGVYRDKPIAGLLGLNVLRRYRVSVDDSAGVIELVAHGEFDDRSADIEPWLEAEVQRPESDSDSQKISLQVRNHAPLQIQDVELDVQCISLTGERQTTRARTGRVRARSTVEVRVDEDRVNCPMVDAEVASATW